MKKLFLSMFAVAGMLFATSCQEELDIPMEDKATVAFKVSTPEIASRAYSDGTTATKLQYAVYSVDEQNELKYLESLTKTTTINNGSANVSFELTSGKKYAAIFWAAASEAPYTVDFANKTMTVDYTEAVNNDENRDAFYKYCEFTVTGNMVEKVELNRPFAQLNVGANDFEEAKNSDYTPTLSEVKVSNVYKTLDLATGVVSNEVENVTFAEAEIPTDEDGKFPVVGYKYIAVNYLLVGAEKEVIDVEITHTDGSFSKTRKVGSVPVQRNYRTNIYGKLLTNNVDVNVEIKPGYNDDNKYGVEEGKVYTTVNNTEEFNSAFNDGVDIIILGEDINLNEIVARATISDPTYTVAKELTINLNGKKLSATSTATGKNYNLFVVKNGTLTVKNGTIEYQHVGENMAWNSSTNIFHVEKATLNLEGVTAKNLGGSDMGFVAHLNNWGEVTLNVENSTLESNYVAVRVFNSGNDMNNVTIKNTTLKGGSYAFWVHNYTVEDFGTEAKAEAHKALLNLNIYNQGNTFSPDVNGIRYGFTNSVKSDAYGITKVVSEDGTEVTLGSVVEDGLIRRGVAGTEGNETIKKVVVGEGVATLYDRTFRRFYALETVELPSSLTTIGAAGTGVFQSCSALKNITIPESVTVLGNGSFYGCTSLESINIPAGVTRIEENCLRETGLVEVEFHAGVTYFGAQAFRDCKQLTKVVINAPKFTIEPNAFGVMSGTLPGTTIYVANAEMKAYLESTLSYASQFTVVAPGVVNSAEDLETALKAGGRVMLGQDITLVKSLSLNNTNIYLNGNGHTITMADNATNEIALFDINGGKATIMNVVFDGIKNGAVVRTVDTDFEVDNVTAQNCTHNVGEGIFRLRGKNTIKNSTFKNNTSSQGLILTLNFDGEAPELPQVVENCVFEGNTANSSAIVYYVKGSSCTINANKFVGNTVNCNTNGATLYMGFQENCVITNNLFKNNTVNESNTSSRVAGGVFFGYDAVFTGNAFVGNYVTGENVVAKDVCVSTYYTSINLSGNYWGGSAPVENENYFVQHKNDERTVIINDYLTTF